MVHRRGVLFYSLLLFVPLAASGQCTLYEFSSTNIDLQWDQPTHPAGAYPWFDVPAQNCTVTITADQPWLQFSVGQIPNVPYNTWMRYTVTLNLGINESITGEDLGIPGFPGYYGRVGHLTITINGTSTVATTIGQFAKPACSYTVSPTALTLSAAGGPGGPISIQATPNNPGVPCSWDASSTATWITGIIPASGTASGPLSFTAAANTGPTRSGVINVADQTVTVFQPTIDGVEMTQAIQEIQTLSDLENSLATYGQPPVPIIAGKPGVMRVYAHPAQTLLLENITLSIPGLTQVNSLEPYKITKPVVVSPDCNRDLQRAGTPGCPSADFYLTPPPGAWTATLQVSDPQTGTIFETDTLHFNSWQALPLKLIAVPVCPSIIGCGDPDGLLGRVGFLSGIAPTDYLGVGPTSKHQILGGEAFRNYCPAGIINRCDLQWWVAVNKVLQSWYLADEAATDIQNGTHTIYVGLVPPDIDPVIQGMGIPGTNAAALEIPANFVFPSVTVDLGDETIAHEVGHALGMTHTNTGYPPASGPPGCWGIAQDPDTDWPWKPAPANPNGDNRVRSPAGVEYGFDEQNHKIIDGNGTYELGSYCTPRWVSPFTYNKMVAALTGQFPATPSSATHPNVKHPSQRAYVNQTFWTISGTIPSAGPVQFDPIFQSVLTGDTSGGAGEYALNVLDGTGKSIFVQYFDPVTPVVEGNSPSSADPIFTTLVPAGSGAADIVLLDPSGTELGRVTLGGTAPTVTITNPTGAFDGSTAISWTIADPDSNSFTSKVYYSTDKGATWSEIGVVPDGSTTLTVDFSSMPGTSGQTGLIRVLVSDGVNTGQATSPAFMIARKLPTAAQITGPTANSVLQAADPVHLTGFAYDPDDGVLSGASLSWSSNLQGALGTNSDLMVSLRPGVHTISLIGTDSDGNSISAAMTLTIADQPPLLGLTLDSESAGSGCVEATITATPGMNGAPLSLVQYSVDGGSSYNTIPSSQLPFAFLAPVGATAQVLARATDTSNQTSAKSASAALGVGCAAITVPNVVSLTQAAAATALAGNGLAVGTVTRLASTVAAGNVVSQSPLSGASIQPGSSIAVNLVISSGDEARCDVDGSGAVDIADVQLLISQALGLTRGVFDVNADGIVNVTDVQTVIGAVLSGSCAGGH